MRLFPSFFKAIAEAWAIVCARFPCRAVETVIVAIRAKHGVSEAAMSAAMQAHQTHLQVQASVQALREAMSGKEPPGYSERERAKEEAADAEAAKQRLRRAGKQRQRRA